MGWFQYYQLLEEHNGDLSKASKEEMNWAAKGNPNDPHSARALAEKKWREEQESKQSKISCNPVLMDSAAISHQPKQEEKTNDFMQFLKEDSY